MSISIHAENVRKPKKYGRYAPIFKTIYLHVENFSGQTKSF